MMQRSLPARSRTTFVGVRDGAGSTLATFSEQFPKNSPTVLFAPFSSVDLVVPTPHFGSVRFPPPPRGKNQIVALSLELSPPHPVLQEALPLRAEAFFLFDDPSVSTEASDLLLAPLATALDDALPLRT